MITANFLIVVHNENFSSAKVILSFVFESVPFILRHTMLLSAPIYPLRLT